MGLRQELEDPQLRILDATVHLRREFAEGPYTVESGRQSYHGAHIPGAAFADIPGELSDPVSPFPFALPSPETFAQAMSELGVGPGTTSSPMRKSRRCGRLVFGGSCVTLDSTTCACSTGVFDPGSARDTR